MLLVLAILHVAITIPHCWLAGKCSGFFEHDFGLYDMGLTVDLFEDAFLAIKDDGKLILNEDFLDKVPPFKSICNICLRKSVPLCLVLARMKISGFNLMS